MNQETQQHANGDYAGFFSDAAQALDIAKQAQANLDHKAATGFSVFDYFRVYENDLSKVFAGLLNPRGGHGQREAFLQCFLEEASFLEEGKSEKLGYPRADEYWRVHVEYATDANRRIDIVLNKGDRWLGIENKPWAADQENQVGDYLEFLNKMDEKARVCYFSGYGGPPPPTSYREQDKSKCLTVPYRKTGQGPSIERWIERCLQSCEAEPVRWFLKDLLKYVRYQFSMEGVPAIDYKGDVMTDTMKDFIVERSKSDARAWDTAVLVEMAMPEVRRSLLTQFIKEVKEELENQIQNQANSLKGWTTSISDAEKLMQKNEGQLVLHKESWRLTPAQGDGWLAAGVAINAQSDDWKWVNLCVAAPNKEYGDELREALKAKKPLFSVNENYAPVPIYENKGNWNDNEFLKDTVSEKSRKEKAREVAAQMVTLAKDIESIIDKMFPLKSAT
ncbi:MAG: PD-(D/E)XK nuclease family protein [Gammaproteobacteria bacterium]|nr:PD-(D/E)XK nuclease family protein [Gammaproteobacteria bacterium]